MNQEKVMENQDLRRLIWSYLRKKPQKICCYCKKVLVWDNKVCNYIEDVKFLYHFSTNPNPIVPLCMDCQLLRLPRCTIS
mgnify:CR=1 FL=1